MSNNKPLKIFCVVGTRPEFIKMFPVYSLLKTSEEENRSERELDVKWISSSQHNELLEDLEVFFSVKPDYKFKLKNRKQDQNTRLGFLAADILAAATELFNEEKPDLIFVQGDTLTAKQCALAAFYLGIKIAHIEAGIRTNNVHSPFPEELSRRVISQVSDLNFAPGKVAHNSLEAEKIMFKKKSYNFYTGNTVIDTLEYSIHLIEQQSFDWHKYTNCKHAFSDEQINLKSFLEEQDRKFIIITAHRRENIETANYNLANAILRLAESEHGKDLNYVICLHKNPETRKAFEDLYQKCQVRNLNNIIFLESVSYPMFLKLMASSYFIVTDSGGIQEEAPYLSKPVLIFRDLTERVEGVELGLAKLIGTRENVVHGAMLELIQDPNVYNSMIKTDLQPYGDGLAGKRIVDVTLLYLKDKN